jgi:LacI family transcriptional regulator
MPPVTMKDVAARAGVSVGTVSNVLNRPSTVRPATRAKVEIAIAELEFVPNASARQLVVGQSRTIAYVVLDAANPFFTDVARGIEEVTGPQGFSLFLCDSDQSSTREDRYLERLTEMRVGGVLITAFDYENPHLWKLRKLGVPVVLVDRPPDTVGAWCSVGVDDVSGGEMAMAHLLELGHTRLAFAGGPPAVPQVADRLHGARRAVGATAIAGDALQYLETPESTVAEGQRVAERLLGLPKRSRPTGVFCANDLLAVGVVRSLLHNGLRVPEDLAVVGYDDIAFASAASVPLTSVAQPRQLLGQSGAELLLDESAEGHEHRNLMFVPELVARASTVGRHGNG